MENNPKTESPPDDHDELMNHVALEAIHGIHNNDHDAFRQAHHVLIADILNRLSDEMESKEMNNADA